MNTWLDNDRKFLCELAKNYPNRHAVVSEIINLNAILNLPKGTEHFMSDIHGEYEAFLHIRRNASGVIRKKIDWLFSNTVPEKERAELATLIYYPKEKLEEILPTIDNVRDWYKITLIRLLEVCRLVSSKYTRSKVRKHLARAAAGYDYIIDELLNNDYDVMNKDRYYDNILKTIIDIGAAEKFIEAVCSAIKSLVVDHLHIVGDIFDRGPRADIIMDALTEEGSLDIQWGNHDVLWMGAAAGSPVCMATVLNNSITYKNLDVLEIGYGISLRPLSLFANETYAGSDVSAFMPKADFGGDCLNRDDDALIARMNKAISIIQFKLEGQAILRNPDFRMEDRLLLDKIDWDTGCIRIENTRYRLKDHDFPTVDPADPYALTPDEQEVMRYFKTAFMRSERLQRHVRFLYEKGELYTVYNRNLLFHGCVPMQPDGTFLPLPAAGGRCGRELMDYCDRMARQGYFSPEGTPERLHGTDFLWFLWCGPNSPLCGRTKITTFERHLIDDEAAWTEPKNAYYDYWNDAAAAERILREFSLEGEGSHIVNGHMPVHRSQGEQPVKAGGRLIVIDGGFCKAYQPATGIAGYTLIYNAEGMRISAHEPFNGMNSAVKNNADILSDTVVFEYARDKIRVRDTDTGKRISDKIQDLTRLLQEFESGRIKESGF